MRMCVTQNILLVFTCKRVQLCSGNFSFLGLGKSKEVGSMHFDTDNVLYFKKKEKKKILTVFLRILNNEVILIMAVTMYFILMILF